MCSSELPTAVVLGLSPTGLYVVRELGRAGVPVVGVASESQCGGWSKYLSRPAIEEPREERRLSLLLDLVQEMNEKPVLFAASDQDIDFVLRHAAVLAQYFQIQSSYLDGSAQRLMTKSSLYAMSAATDIPTPFYTEVTREDVARHAGDLAYPCLIKPSRIDAVKQQMAGRKLWTLKERRELIELAPRLPEGNTTWILQELVPGPESEITLYASYVDDSGAVHQATTCRKLRQFPPGFGSASLVRTWPDEEVRVLSEALLRHASYKGIAATEFKRDPRDGRLKIIEMNPRASLWFSVTGAAGRAVSLAAYRNLAELPMLPEQSQIDDVQWRYGPKDLYSRLFYSLSRDFPLPPPDLRALKPPTRRVFPVFAPDDPLPSLAELVGLGRKFFLRVRRRNRDA